VAIYVEALSDLTPDQIEAGCAEATRIAEQFPKPGHIRAAVPPLHYTFLGLPQLTYPVIPQEEREEALAFSAAVRERLQIVPKQSVPPKKKFTSRPSLHSVEEQKEMLRKKGYSIP
jgi:hypothetical protein